MTDRPVLDIQDIIARETAGEALPDMLAETGYSSDEIASELEGLAQLGHAIERLGSWLRSGDPQADWAIVMLTIDFSETERMEALRRILGRLKGPPIDPIRRSRNYPALMAALEDLGQTEESLSEARALELVREALGRLTPREVQQKSEDVMRSFATALDRLIWEDLLGPGWRGHMGREVSWVADQETELEENHPWAARADLDILISRAGLSPAEEDALRAYRECNDWSDAAITLEISPEAMWKRKERVVRKLRQAAKIRPS